MSNLEAAVRALDAGDLGGALDAVIAAWRVQRQPALADLVERVSAAWLAAGGKKGVPLQLAAGATSIAAAWRAVTGPTLDADDPRLASALVHVLFERRMFQGTSARTGGFGVQHAAALARLGDVRRIDVLRARLASPTAFPSAAAAAIARPAYEAAIASLEARRDALPPLPEAARDAIAAIDERLPAVRARGSTAATAAKFASQDVQDAIDAVLARPDDLELRRVIGDRLAELGDPRGEYIALQFAARAGDIGAAGAARVTTLFNKHASHWAGALAPISRREGIRFELGFVTGLMLHKSSLGMVREMWDAALESPLWATVEDVQVGRAVPGWWIAAVVASPRSARVRRFAFERARGTAFATLTRPEPGAPLQLRTFAPEARGDRKLAACLKALGLAA